VIIQGRDTNTLPEQFKPLTGGVLTLDADSMLYAACNSVARLSTAISRAKTRIFELQFLTGCKHVRAHLTARGNYKAGRHLLIGAQAYQDNRKGIAKPPLLEPLREHLAKPEVFQEHEGVQVFLHHDIEADDALMIDAYSIPGVIGYSPDKDLRILPCGWFDTDTGRVDFLKDRYGWIALDRKLATPKAIGHGTRFFWCQMLMGDVVDNVKGLLYYERYKKPKRKRDLPILIHDDAGPKYAVDLLGQCDTENDAANAVLDLYRKIDQNPLPEACMLWLLRTLEDTAEGYIWSLNLSDNNRAFIRDCYNRVYRKDAAEENEYNA